MVNNLSGPPKQATLETVDKAMHQAATTAMRIERSRTNPGFGELPSIAENIASMTTNQNNQPPPSQQVSSWQTQPGPQHNPQVLQQQPINNT